MEVASRSLFCQIYTTFSTLLYIDCNDITNFSGETWREFFLFHFPLAAQRLSAKFDFVGAVALIEFVDDAH